MKIDMRSSFSLSIERSRDTVICEGERREGRGEREKEGGERGRAGSGRGRGVWRAWGIRCSTATSASAIFAAKVSRASLRSSFFTASCAAIFTSYTSSSSYISFTCCARSSISLVSSRTRLTLSQYDAKSRSEL